MRTRYLHKASMDCEEETNYSEGFNDLMPALNMGKYFSSLHLQHIIANFLIVFCNSTLNLLCNQS